MQGVMLSNAHVLLLTDDAVRRKRWSEILAGAGIRVTEQLGRLSRDDRVDVIVADHGVVGELLASNNRQLLRGEPGIISIGASPIADVSLPSDFSRRELKLACLLLAEVIDLRRQLRRGQRAQKLLSHLASASAPTTGASSEESSA
jgi:hypothetical protein